MLFTPESFSKVTSRYWLDLENFDTTVWRLIALSELPEESTRTAEITNQFTVFNPVTIKSDIRDVRVGTDGFFNVKLGNPGVVPFVIQGPSRVFHLGLDFFLTDPSNISTKVDPTDFFMERKGLLVASYQSAKKLDFRQSWHGYEDPSGFIAEYLRNPVKTDLFEKALNSLAGISMLTTPQKLLKISGNDLIFEQQIISVRSADDYRNRLGDLFPRGWAEQRRLKIVRKNSRQNNADEWYRKTANTLRLDLGPYLKMPLPFVVSDMQISAQVQPGNHILFDFPGVNPSMVSEYHAAMWSKEDRYGLYLNDYLQLPDDNQPHQVNFIDLIFQVLLRDRAIILEVIDPHVPFVVLDFFRHHLPLGVVPMISYPQGYFTLNDVLVSQEDLSNN
jgi:hypothetical protein